MFRVLSRRFSTKQVAWPTYEQSMTKAKFHEREHAAGKRLAGTLPERKNYDAEGVTIPFSHVMLLFFHFRILYLLVLFKDIIKAAVCFKEGVASTTLLVANLPIIERQRIVNESWSL